MAANNQNEAEFFAVATTGRRGLEEMTAKMGGELMSIAAKSVRDAGQTWIQRAVVSIANNDQLADVIKTKTGLFSIYKGLAKAATMGLQIGGQFPQAYLTPYDGKAELIVSAEGYKHAAVHGPGAVLADVVFRRVYDGEQFSIDFARAEVKHSYDGKADRGKLVGVYCVMTRPDGAQAVDYMTKLEALAIRDGHSRAYKMGKGPWKTDEDAMIEKTAAKKFLRKYAAEAEGLAMLFAQDSDEPAEDTTPPPRDVSDRMAGRLDSQTAKMEASAARPAEPATKAPQDDAIQGQAEAVDDEPGDAPGAAPGSSSLF
jgi:recombination protein RecT